MRVDYGSRGKTIAMEIQIREFHPTLMQHSTGSSEMIGQLTFPAE